MIKMAIKKGDIFFSENDYLYSKLINLYNRVTFGKNGPTHAGIVTEVHKHYYVVYEALKEGFVASEYGKAWTNEQIKEGKIYFKRPIYELKNLEENAKKYLGVPYAWYDIFKIGLMLLTGLKGIYFTGANKLICSEAVARLLYDCSNKKIKLGYNKRKSKQKSEYKIPYDLISPMHIYKSKYMKYIKK